MENKGTVLIVEDVGDFRDLLTIFLESGGYNVEEAGNGVEALSILNNVKVDLVVTDILMPEMDGVELITTVMKSQPEMKFIIISGGGRQLGSKYDYLAAAQKLTGVAKVLKKPFESAELLEMVDEMLAV